MSSDVWEAESKGVVSLCASQGRGQYEKRAYEPTPGRLSVGL